MDNLENTGASQKKKTHEDDPCDDWSKMPVPKKDVEEKQQ